MQAVATPGTAGAKGLVAALGVLVAALLAEAVAFLILFGLAPLRQRNEAREALRATQLSIDFEVSLHEDHDIVLVAVHNKGPASTFEASVLDVTGAGRPVPVPWPIKWRDHPDRSCQIMTGDTEMLRLAHYTGFSFAFSTPTTTVKVGDRFFVGRQLNVRLRIATIEPRVERQWTIQMRYETTGYQSGFSLRLVDVRKKRGLPRR